MKIIQLINNNKHIDFCGLATNDVPDFVQITPILTQNSAGDVIMVVVAAAITFLLNN